MIETFKLAVTLLLLAGCNAQSVQQKRLAELPCYDGWSTYKTGSSVVYSPSQVEMLNVQNQLPADRKLGCWHQKPSGEIVVLSVDSSGTARAAEFVPGEEGLTKSSNSEELVVRVY